MEFGIYSAKSDPVYVRAAYCVEYIISSVNLTVAFCMPVTVIVNLD